MQPISQYAVTVDVSGSVTCIVQADTAKEARKIALERVAESLTGLHNKTYNVHAPKQSYTKHHSFDEIVGASSLAIDSDEYYDIVLNYLGGPSALKHCLPATKEEVKERCDKDKNLNEIPLAEWDRAAGYGFSDTGIPIKFHTNLQGVLQEHDISYYTCSECVGLLKRTAQKLTENE